MGDGSTTNTGGTISYAATVVQATYTYDDAGRVKSMKNADDKYAFYDYTARGEKSHVWGQTVNPVEYIYDDFGRVYLQKTFRGGSDWDEDDWAHVTPGKADFTRWDYDEASGVLLGKYDAANLDSSGNPISGAKKVAYTYTGAGQIYTRTWARGTVTTYGYSSTTGELTGATYSDSTPTLTYTYNRLGQTGTVTDATGSARTFNYALTATLELQNEVLGTTSSNFYGDHRITYPYGASVVFGRSTGLKLGTSSDDDADQAVTYGYASDGRLNSFAAGGQTFAYGYTADSHLIGTVTNSGANYTDTRTYELDHDWVASRTTTITGATIPTVAAFTYTQDTMGRVQNVTKTGEMFAVYGTVSPYGLTTTYGYNDRSELTSENSADLAGTPVNLTGRQTSYDYDGMGNRKEVTKARATGDAGGNLTFDYNSSGHEINNLNQYVRRTVPALYDVAAISSASSIAVSGITSGAMVKQGEYFFRGHPLDNSLAPIFDTLTITPNGGSGVPQAAFLPYTNEDFTYDDDGNLTRDGRWVYEYDAENRLIAMFTRGAPEDPDSSVTANVDVWTAGLLQQKLVFTYDYLGRRVQKTSYVWNSAPTAHWVLDDALKFIYSGWHCIAKIDVTVSGEPIIANYFWGLDLSGTIGGAGGVGGLLMVQEGGETYLPAYDAMGNVHAMIKASDGSIAATYEYDAFGQTLRESGAYAASNPFRFSTKYTDIETGLINHDTRYYSPSLGRFLNRDSIGEQGGLNLYAYVNNRVPNAWDYLGMDDDSISSSWNQLYYMGTDGLWHSRFPELTGEVMTGNQIDEAGVRAATNITWGSALSGTTNKEIDASTDNFNAFTASNWANVLANPGTWSALSFGSTNNSSTTLTVDSVNKSNSGSDGEINLPSVTATLVGSNQNKTEMHRVEHIIITRDINLIYGFPNLPSARPNLPGTIGNLVSTGGTIYDTATAKPHRISLPSKVKFMMVPKNYSLTGVSSLGQKQILTFTAFMGTGQIYYISSGRSEPIDLRDDSIFSRLLNSYDVPLDQFIGGNITDTYIEYIYEATN